MLDYYAAGPERVNFPASDGAEILENKGQTSQLELVSACPFLPAFAPRERAGGWAVWRGSQFGWALRQNTHFCDAHHIL